MKNFIKINPTLKEANLSWTEYYALKHAHETGDLDFIAAMFEEGTTIPDTLEGLLEALTVAQRVKRGNSMKRHEAVLASARKRVLARHADKGRLDNRSHKSAVDAVKSKYAGGQKVADLSYGDKARVEDILKTKKGAVQSLSRKMLSKVRDRETARHANKSKNKGE